MDQTLYIVEGLFYCHEKSRRSNRTSLMDATNDVDIFFGADRNSSYYGPSTSRDGCSWNL